MSMNPAKNGSAPSGNGTAWFLSSLQQAMASIGKKTPKSVHPVAPADAEPRPDHETLEGPGHVSGPICRETDEPVIMAEKLFQYYENASDPGILELKLRLDSARYMAEVYRVACEKTDADVQERRAARASALAQFGSQAAAVRADLQAATATLTYQLAQINAAIANTDALAVALHAQPGVPPAALYTQTTDTKAEGVTSPKEQNAAAPKKKRRFPLRFNMKTCAIPAIGTLFGLSVAMERNLLVLQDVKNLETDALIRILYMMSMGACLTWVAHELAFKGFLGAGERAGAEERGRTSFLNWFTLRHALVPTGVVSIVAAAEAVVMRNALLNSSYPPLPNPGSLVHYLSGLIFLLPLSGLGAFDGWREGTRRMARRVEWRAARTAQKEQAEKNTTRTRASAAAQWAHAFDAHIAKLHQRKTDIIADIARISQSYENIIAQLEAAATADPEMSPREARILQGARADAGFAYARFLLELKCFRLRQLGYLLDPDEVTVVLNMDRRPQVTVVVPKKPSIWQRIVRFFQRVRGRQEETP